MRPYELCCIVYVCNVCPFTSVFAADLFVFFCKVKRKANKAGSLAFFRFVKVQIMRNLSLTLHFVIEKHDDSRFYRFCDAFNRLLLLSFLPRDGNCLYISTAQATC